MQIMIELPTPPHVLEALLELNAKLGAPPAPLESAAQETGAPAEPAPKRRRAEKAAAPEPAASESGATYEQVGQALRDYVKAHGREAGVAVLERFKVARPSELKPDLYADVLAELKAASK